MYKDRSWYVSQSSYYKTGYEPTKILVYVTWYPVVVLTTKNKLLER